MFHILPKCDTAPSLLFWHLMASLRLKDLHPVYQTVSHEEAIAIANLGAQTYMAAKEGLYEAWSTTQSAEEGEKADLWRREGGQTMMEKLKERLQAGDVAASRVAALQSAADAAAARATALQASVDTEVERRLAEVLESKRTEFELGKMGEISALRSQVAMAQGKEKGYALLENSHAAMNLTIESLQKELAKFKEATSTKSSYALGKLGEIELADMLTKHVLPQFQYSEMKDMTAVKHMGDFHLWIVGPTMKHVKLLVDSKKYSSPVQHIEIEKLYSDVDGDETVEAGLMISLDTAICTKAQFQITKTKKNKPCMFLSFEKLDDGIRQEVLCWAIRSLVSIASVQERGKRDAIVEEMELFLKDLNSSVAELDVCIKSAKGVYDMLRDSKERMVARIHTCRVNCGLESTKDVITHVDAAPAAETRCKGTKTNGERCKSVRKTGGDYCSRHSVEEK